MNPQLKSDREDEIKEQADLRHHKGNGVRRLPKTRTSLPAGYEIGAASFQSDDQTFCTESHRLLRLRRSAPT
jgi:hypothetical protein